MTTPWLRGGLIGLSLWSTTCGSNPVMLRPEKLSPYPTHEDQIRQIQKPQLIDPKATPADIPPLAQHEQPTGHNKGFSGAYSDLICSPGGMGRGSIGLCDKNPEITT